MPESLPQLALMSKSWRHWSKTNVILAAYIYVHSLKDDDISAAATLSFLMIKICIGWRIGWLSSLRQRLLRAEMTSGSHYITIWLDAGKALTESIVIPLYCIIIHLLFPEVGQSLRKRILVLMILYSVPALFCLQNQNRSIVYINKKPFWLYN